MKSEFQNTSCEIGVHGQTGYPKPKTLYQELGNRNRNPDTQNALTIALLLPTRKCVEKCVVRVHSQTPDARIRELGTRTWETQTRNSKPETRNAFTIMCIPIRKCVDERGARPCAGFGFRARNCGIRVNVFVLRARNRGFWVQVFGVRVDRAVRCGVWSVRCGV